MLPLKTFGVLDDVVEVGLRPAELFGGPVQTALGVGQGHIGCEGSAGQLQVGIGLRREHLPTGPLCLRLVLTRGPFH